MQTLLKFGALAVLSLALSSCLPKTTTSPDAGSADAGAPRPDSGPVCANPCGSDCCTTGQTCGAGQKCVAACTPKCQNKLCGDDTCGGSCGTCLAGNACDAATGTCRACTPSCSGRSCGDDGCGGSCGTCASGSACSGDFTCMCAPKCAGKTCGDDGCGGSCGRCSGATTCNAAGTSCEACPAGCADGAPCSTLCTGSCGVCSSAGQTCSAAGTCACVPSCGGKTCGPNGCGGSCGTCSGSTSCDASTGTCKAVTYSCPGNCPSAQGLGCYDPNTSGSGSTCTCLPERNTSSGSTLPDTCASQGKICDFNFNAPAASTCRLPKDKETCTRTIGCATGWDCTTLTGGSLCLQKCTRTTDCDNGIDYCETTAGSVISNHCWYNICAQPVPAQGGPNPSERAKYFQPCVAGGPADGTCYPLRTRDSSGTAVDIGVCFQNGTAPSQGKCNPEGDRRSSSGLTDLCPANEFCVGVSPDAARPGKIAGLCRPACNAGPGPGTSPVKGCPGTMICGDGSGADPGTMVEARLGLCAKSCSLFGTDSCGTDLLNNTLGCGPSGLEGNGACRALIPNAPATAGATCTLTNDPRNECGDRLYCRVTAAGATGSCTGFCDTRVCASPNAPCSSCSNPSANKCGVVDPAVTHVLGVCGP